MSTWVLKHGGGGDPAKGAAAVAQGAVVVPMQQPGRLLETPVPKHAAAQGHALAVILMLLRQRVRSAKTTRAPGRASGDRGPRTAAVLLVLL